jgi:hypothetical protein
MNADLQLLCLSGMNAFTPKLIQLPVYNKDGGQTRQTIGHTCQRLF